MGRSLPKWQPLPTATGADERMRDRMITRRWKKMTESDRLRQRESFLLCQRKAKPVALKR